MITNTEKKIVEPGIGKNDGRKKAYPVIIDSGEFCVGGRVSNFWYWQRLSPTGRINPKVEHGYGNFFLAEGYEVQRKIIVKK
jgi:hypothetical protein